MTTPTINLTQHIATPEQISDGVVDLDGDNRDRLKKLLNFVELPDPGQVLRRAEDIADLAARQGAPRAMIGGAPFLMGPLEQALSTRGILPVYAFSRRESVEEPLPDGSVRKVAVFKHLGFVVGETHDGNR